MSAPSQKPSKAELLFRIIRAQSSRAANAVRRLIADFDMIQREIAKATGRSLGWVNAMSQWTPDKDVSPFGSTTKAERVQHAERRRYKRRNRAGLRERAAKPRAIGPPFR